jgi:hypothetical protein
VQHGREDRPVDPAQRAGAFLGVALGIAIYLDLLWALVSTFAQRAMS